ncbi:MAG: [Protein-PII] uridylyltransferase / [Protein-PII]-UMP uridylyl-removing enzyme, partial [uncultured Acetobacteraceae bacterium]
EISGRPSRRAVGAPRAGAGRDQCGSARTGREADRARGRRRADAARSGAGPAAPPPRRHPGERAIGLRGAAALRLGRRALARVLGRRAHGRHPRLRGGHGPTGGPGARRRGTALRAGGDRRLRPRRAGPLLRHRPPVPDGRGAGRAGAAAGGVRPVPALGPGAEGGPRHPQRPRVHGGSGARHERAHRPGRCALPGGRAGGVRPLPGAVRPDPAGARPRPLPHRQAGGAHRPPRALRRQPLSGGAAREGGARRPARPPDPLLARALRLRHGADAGAGGAGQPRRRPAVRARGSRHPAGLEFPLDRAVPPPLRRRPCGGAADLRLPARGRRPHGLRAARPAGRRRALHEAPVPDGARRDPADPRAGAGDRARGAGGARRAPARRRGARGGGPRAGRRQAGGGAARARL